MGPFSWPHLSQVQIDTIIEDSIEITSAIVYIYIVAAGSMKPGGEGS